MGARHDPTTVRVAREAARGTVGAGRSGRSVSVLMGQLCTFTLTRLPWRRAPLGLVAVSHRRVKLGEVRDAAFARLLGTGHASSAGAGVDVRRWATFVAWKREPDLAAWHRSHAAVAAEGECWSVLLEVVSAHGQWGGVELDGPEVAVPPPGPIAVLTRARVCTSRVPALLAAASTVEKERAAAPGLLASVSIRDWPVWVQGSFSLWCDVASMRAFARASAGHGPVIRRTRSDGWYTEELFARFRPLASVGAWDGRDPLAG